MFEIVIWIIELLSRWIWGFFTEWEYFFGTIFFVFIAYLIYKVYDFGKIDKGGFYDC